MTGRECIVFINRQQNGNCYGQVYNFCCHRTRYNSHSAAAAAVIGKGLRHIYEYVSCMGAHVSREFLTHVHTYYIMRIRFGRTW